MYGVSLKDNLRYIRRGSNETAHCWYRDHLVQPSLAQSEGELPVVGTGFFVSASGHVLTADNVVRDCQRIAIKTSSGSSIQASVVASDSANDLAPLTSSVAPPKVASFQEKISGGGRSDRRGLARVMAKLSKGDTLVVCRLDSLARSSRDLLNLLHEIGLTRPTRQFRKRFPKSAEADHVST